MTELKLPHGPNIRACALLAMTLLMNDVTAQHSQIELSYSVYEEVDQGTVFGNVKADLAAKNLPGLSSDTTFRMLSGPSVFEIARQTGVLQIVERLDRDTGECQSVSLCVEELAVAVQTPQQLSIIKVNIEVLDINDNSPRFSQTAKRLTIRENSAISTHLSLPIATDPDSPGYAVQRYELVPKDDSIFKLQVRYMTLLSSIPYYMSRGDCL